jgi:hypothetical protein
MFTITGAAGPRRVSQKRVTVVGLGVSVATAWRVPEQIMNAQAAKGIFDR